jgi:hypothetical protein
MSTVKITELPLISSINANTANTLFLGVDVPTLTTGKMTVTTLANGLYSNNILNVGANPVLYTNVIGQFSGTDPGYLQVNLQNFNANGSSDYVASTNDSNNSNSYIDMGISGNNYNDAVTYGAFKPYDGYLYTYGPTANGAKGNLIIGTASANANVMLMVGGTQPNNIMGWITKNSITLNTQSYITFADGTRQTTAGATNAYSIAAFTVANSAAANTVVSQGVNSTQNTNIQSAWTQANLANSIANTAVQNTTTISVRNLTLTGNLLANTLNTTVSFDNITSNNATFSKDIVILGQLTANTLLGNVFFSNVVTGTSQSNSILWFAQATSPTQTPGQVWYSANTISLVQDTDIIGDRPAISKVLFERVYNNTGSSIPDNSWVRLAGAVTSNSVPYIQLADASSAANSQVEGFIKVGIANGAYGFVYTRGIVDGMDASTFGTNGQLLFLSTTPGQASNVAPTGANSVVSVAKILSNGSANGKLQVVIANQQAYGKPNGAILFANNNLIQASNTLFINEQLGQLNVSSTLYAANGIINRISTYPSTQTAITINMTTDTWVRANVGASLTVTPTGFGAGLEAELIITNPNSGGGAARTITHGCSAVNSSVGATTFTLGGTTTAFIKYYSFDGDLANTYVKISYS